MSGHDPIHYGYWRSLAELADAPSFRAQLEAEFPDAGQPFLTTEGAGGVDRRRWLQLLGASLALAGAAGCRWEKEEVLPFAKRPADRVPGERERFATAMDLAGSPLGLLVTCVDGRPIKIEGNPKHPASRGATDLLAQASILELYDPDRSRLIFEKTLEGPQARKWDEFLLFAQRHFAAVRKAGGAGFYVLAEASSSPSRAALQKRLAASLPQAKWLVYEPADFGPASQVRYHLDKAEVIACLDADLLGTYPYAVANARAFAHGRDPAARKMNRLYAVEGCLSLTGAVADHRLPLRSEQMAAFVRDLSRLVTFELLTKEDDDGAKKPDQPAARDAPSQPAAFLKALAADLVAAKGKSLVAIGPAHGPELQRAVAEINRVLGNLGQTVSDYAADARDPTADIVTLATDAVRGKVETLLILGGNPLYTAPADLDFAAALAKVKTTIHLGLYRDETAQRATWHVPQAHYLESWGDAQLPEGPYSVQQPMISPLYDGKSAIEMLSAILDETPIAGRELVRAEFRRLAGEKDTEQLWRRVVHDGVWAEAPGREPASQPGAAAATTQPPGAAVATTQQPAAAAPAELGAAWDGTSLDLVFVRDAKLFDGRFANNGWLQELPDPLTRLTWDNAALLSPATAAAMGVEDSTLVTLRLKGRELQLPAYLLPGMADGTVAVALGYGRTAAGKVGGEAGAVPPVGANAYALRTSDAMWRAAGLTVEPTGQPYALASVQDHWPIDQVGLAARAGRVPVLIREATLAEYRQRPDFARHAVHHPPAESLWEEPPYAGRRWAMAVDLSKCTGCGACVLACQAENNIPVVGKERVLRNREMHWLRIDRYYRGPADDPQVRLLPVLCQQCEMAPCEGVCPVNATVHSSEGLNDMVYNRCVGTRYCANNCPYKVRRFNYFNYQKGYDDPAHEVRKMANNPEVTVRSRGVMEKCTYCVQRIQAAKIAAKNQRRPVGDGEVVTACQQACPAGAIVFGDLGPAGEPPQTAVARLFADPRTYELLGELNHKARTRYLARVRNPNPALASPGDDATAPAHS